VNINNKQLLSYRLVISCTADFSFSKVQISARLVSQLTMVSALWNSSPST